MRLPFLLILCGALAERFLTAWTQSSTSDVAGVSVTTDCGLELKTGDALESGVVASEVNADTLRADWRVTLTMVGDKEQRTILQKGTKGVTNKLGFVTSRDRAWT